MSWCVWLLPSPLTHTTDGLKERKIRWLVLQSWGQSTVSGPGLRWASVWNSHVPAFLLFILIYLILPLCHSLGPSYAALKFANPEYITVSGKATSFLSYSWHWDLPLFSTCPQNNCGILLSSEISKRKKNLTSWKWCSSSGFLFFPFLFSPHHELQPDKEQWHQSCPISH